MARTRSARGRRKPAFATAETCFLCLAPIAPEDLEDAYARVLTDEVPSRTDYAHAACAREAGYEDQPDAEDEAPRAGST
jgi:hypothetical protein